MSASERAKNERVWSTLVAIGPLLSKYLGVAGAKWAWQG